MLGRDLVFFEEFRHFVGDHVAVVLNQSEQRKIKRRGGSFSHPNPFHICRLLRVQGVCCRGGKAWHHRI